MKYDRHNGQQFESVQLIKMNRMKISFGKSCYFLSSMFDQDKNKKYSIGGQANKQRGVSLIKS